MFSLVKEEDWKMALLHYFERKDSKKQSLLPHPNHPLAKVLPPSTIKAANLWVRAIMKVLNHPGLQQEKEVLMLSTRLNRRL